MNRIAAVGLAALIAACLSQPPPASASCQPDRPEFYAPPHAEVAAAAEDEAAATTDKAAEGDAIGDRLLSWLSGAGILLLAAGLLADGFKP